MTLQVCKWLLLLAVAAAQIGCASTETVDTTPAPALEAAPNPMPDHDDSHGWGTNIQGAGSHP